jgi:probable HAF family extracellular repeat protein
MRTRVGAAAAAAIFAVVVATGCTLPVTDLGGATSEAYDVNAAGVVVGVSELAGSSTSHAFKRLPDGSAVDLGTLDGTTSSVAIEVNDAGVAVGWSEGGGPRRVVVWDEANQIDDLGFDAYPFDINEAGVVVGLDLVVPGRDGRAAFVYDPAVGHPVPLPELPGSTHSEAWGLNDAGQAVGSVNVAGGSIPVVWDLAAGTVTDLRPTTQLAFAADIGDDGTIVGATPDYRAAIWSPGAAEATPITPVQAIAITISDGGTVVGHTPYAPQQAFRWSATTGLEWLGTPGEQTQARGVNDRGHVVGSAGDKAVFLFPTG